MASKRIELLLLESVENLGIVGDIVRVKPGFARNHLLPLCLAEPPTPKMIETLKDRRVIAERERFALRSAREELLARMDDIKLTLVRSCNDHGVLYGSVTQRDIADGLQENHYDVGMRSIRLPQPLRRIGEYEIPIQFDKDLRVDIILTIEPDQALEEREEMEFDDEGELITPEMKKARAARRERKHKRREHRSPDSSPESSPISSPDREPQTTSA